ncbi:DNA-binding protein [Xenorhabdus sp. KJ12.1]|uniref:DNA-binding protein n=1 Tax=Xenorhabdus sp. KJ12.1 TaxID=1851571 RepID=UPI000C04164C|nr:DNA-binding protein [Xenorhabdus sp. KJ12.1]PHM72359.1 hypothetical protein Xekj_00638 [Xenorhabdus sp. KJ12.1]
MTNRIPLDPKLPPNFYETPSDERSKHELDCWWDHPYGITQKDGSIAVFCLNDVEAISPTYLGTGSDYYSACLLAQDKQADWVKIREKPVRTILSTAPDRLFWVRKKQCPDDEMTIVSEEEIKREAIESVRLDPRFLIMD